MRAIFHSYMLSRGVSHLCLSLYPKFLTNRFTSTSIRVIIQESLKNYLPPWKFNMTGWKIHHEWRCISYCKWGFSNAMLVFWGVVQVMTTAENCGLKTALMNLAMRPEIAPRRKPRQCGRVSLKSFSWKVTTSWELHFGCVLCWLMPLSLVMVVFNVFFFNGGACFAVEASIWISFKELKLMY